MSQHDYIIANDTGANVRSDLNNALAAIASNNSGSSEPTTTYAFQFWYDTTNNLLKLRNSANSAWITLPFDPTTSGEVNITANSTATANLAFSGGDVTFGDDDKAIFGAGSDLQIYHDGSNSYISDQGTGQLRLLASQFQIMNAAGTESMVFGAQDNTATLYYDNSPKLATTSTGIDVTGTVTADGVALGDSQKATFGASDDLEIYHNGSQSNIDEVGTGDLYLRASNLRLTNSTGTSSTGRYLVAVDGGEVKLFYNNSAVLTTASYGLDVTGIVNATGRMITDAVGSGGGATTGYQFGGDGNSGMYQSAYDQLQFSTGGTERMRIDSVGRVTVGYPSGNIGPAMVQARQPTSGHACFGAFNAGGAGSYLHLFANSSNTALIGAIQNNGNTSVAYNTTSDYRLKTDVQPMTGATERLKALKPVNFEWISTGERVDGFLAHEAQEVVPEAVSGTKDAVLAYGNVTDAEGTVIQEDVTEPETLEEGQVWTKVEDKPEYQGIDQSKLVPLLVATIQELEARIAALESN